MGKSHEYFLSLGSNIQPESNLVEAVRRLQGHGAVEQISGVWESQAIGSAGPNFLNICLEFSAPYARLDLKRQVLNPLEIQMGRVRSADLSAPRTIDIDILLVDARPVNVERWSYAFVLVPLAELLPDYLHPTAGRPLSVVARDAAERTWIVRRAETLEGVGIRREP